MEASDIAKLAADLSIGAITADAIREHYGDGILSAVLGIAGGSIVAGLAAPLVSSLMDETGVSGLIDDVADEVGGFFNDLF